MAQERAGTAGILSVDAILIRVNPLFRATPNATDGIFWPALQKRRITHLFIAEKYFSACGGTGF
jgi:hypothetical protein